MNVRDLSGKRFGKLLVLERLGKFWRCRCDCGNEKIIVGTSLTRKTIPTRSCGCIIRENGNNKLPYGESQFNCLYRSYRRSAKVRKLEFNLTKELFRKLITSNCYYCGGDPVYVSYQPGLNGGFAYNGLDRMNNNIGYIESNVVTCCKICNRAKRNLTLDCFINWIKQLVDYQIKDKVL